MTHIPELDFIVRQEGEYAVRDLIREIEGGGDFSKVEGITYRQNGEILKNPDRMYIKDLNKIPDPPRHLLDMERYTAKLDFEHETPCTSILTSRGCPVDCNFCANAYFWKRTFRRRDPIRVVDEMEEIINKYNIRVFNILDDTFNMKRDHAFTICNEIINRKLNLKWFCRSSKFS